jgi:hypothetical protein
VLPQSAEIGMLRRFPEAATLGPREVLLCGPVTLDLALPNSAASDQRHCTGQTGNVAAMAS